MAGKEQKKYTCPDGGFEYKEQMRRDFDESGYILVRGLLDSVEIGKIRQSLENSKDIKDHSYEREDGDGKACRIALWKHPSDDVTGLMARCEKVAGTCEKLLGGEVYHYHSKLMMKEAFSGGKFVWHQDYGYWYNNGFLTPDMMTLFLAIDKACKENGCLQIIKGSHKCGRINHMKIGGQTGADVERVELIKERLPLELVEMEAGDALFFHSNLLHTSEPNNSSLRRWALLSCYCRASNDTVTPHFLPGYTPLQKVPDDSIRNCTSIECRGKDFMDPKQEEKPKSS